MDPNLVENVKEKKDILVLSNFDSADETFEFILFFLQHVLVEAFLAASNTRAQGFLAYAMQTLLKLCNLDSAVTNRSRDIQSSEYYRRWMSLSEFVRNTLTPFLTSKYTVTIGAISTNCNYPLFSSRLGHAEWLRTFVLDLLQKGGGDNVMMIFSVSSRIIRSQDISIATFLLPFAALNLAVSEDETKRLELQKELTNVLEFPLPDDNLHVRESVILCSEVSSRGPTIILEVLIPLNFDRVFSTCWIIYRAGSKVGKSIIQASMAMASRRTEIMETNFWIQCFHK
jgi:serine/threonine-protein kinase ATR